MKTRDLTVGSISVHMGRLAAPLIVGNIFQQLYNAVDAFVLGRYAGDAAFAAIGIAGSVMNLFLFAIVGACTGISVIFAQFYGAKDLPSFRQEHAHSLGFGLLCTTAISAVGAAATPGLLSLIRTPEDLQPLVEAYLFIILLSMPAAYLYNLYGALLRSVGRTSAALAALAVAAVTHIILDVVFVAHFHWGIRGAAWATAISQLLSAVLCILYLWRFMPELLFQPKDCKLNFPLLRQTAHFSFVTGLHQAGLYIGKLLVQGAVNTGGQPVISAYTATTRIEGFANSFGDSGSAATSVLVAQNRGAKKEDRVAESFRKSLFLMVALGAVCSLTMYLLAGPAVRLMLGAGSGPAYEQACGYMRMISLFYIFCFTGNTFAGYFDGIGKVSIPLIGAISHISLRALLSWLWIENWGLNAVSLATGIGWVLVNAFWGIIYWAKCRKNHS